jgi:hypothetical protein
LDTYCADSSKPLFPKLFYSKVILTVPILSIPKFLLGIVSRWPEIPFDFGGGGGIQSLYKQDSYCICI